MEWLITILVVALIVVVYIAVQKNSDSNRQAKAAHEALSRVGTAWDRSPADLRNQVLSEAGIDSMSLRNSVIVQPWAQIGIQIQTAIAFRSSFLEEFLPGTSTMDTTTMHETRHKTTEIDPPQQSLAGNDESVPLLTVPDQDRMKKVWEAWQQNGPDGVADFWEQEDPIHPPNRQSNSGNS